MTAIYRCDEYPTMPWKNGLGSTKQISIFPSNSSLNKADFLWRLSMASMQQNSDFSTFPGFDRLLAVIQGGEIFLNKKSLPPGSVGQFSGDIPVHCELAEGPVMDIGLIYKRDQVQATMNFITVPAQQSFEDHDTATTNYFVLIQGCVRTTQTELQILDTLQSNELQKFTAVQDSVLCHIKIKVRD